MTVFTWSTTANSNSNADSSINWAENQAPSTVNDSARAMMAAVRKLYNDISGNTVTGGSSTAYTATSSQGHNTAYRDGDFIALRMHTTNGAAPTLNLNSLGAKAIRYATGAAVLSGTLRAGTTHFFCYDSTDDCFYLFGDMGGNLDAPSGTRLLFQQTSAPTGWTKSTTHDNKALRVVSGTAGSGGSANFTSVFTSRTPAGTVGNTTLSTSQIPLHGHPLIVSNSTNNNGASSGGFMLSQAGAGGIVYAAYTGSPSFAAGQLLGGTGGGESHNHTFTGTAMDFAVQYVDVTICVRD